MVMDMRDKSGLNSVLNSFLRVVFSQCYSIYTCMQLYTWVLHDLECACMHVLLSAQASNEDLVFDVF